MVGMESQTTPDVPVSNADIIDLSGLGPEIFANANTVSKWLMSQPEDSRVGIAQALFEKLIYDASNSRQSHGNGLDCVKLCSFVQQSTKSTDQALKQWAFTSPLSIRLFHFYLEWYEHDPHRALRLILDVLVSTCSSTNPSREAQGLIKTHILRTLVSIVARTSTTQLTKSGLQCLDHLLSKQAVTLEEVEFEYSKTKNILNAEKDYQVWREFVFDLFSWMKLSYVSPLAGKCMVHVFRGLEKASVEKATSTSFIAQTGQSWLQEELQQNPDVLDDIKNYLLVPIFKQDKPAALSLLAAFSRQGSLSVIGQELTDQTLLLQLAVLELGKKTGLIGEPSRDSTDGVEQVSEHIALQEAALSSFLAHPSLSVRATAFSLLVSSQATTKPFSPVAFDLLRKHLPAFHADYDAKLRNEVLGLTKALLKRVKNIITVSQRSLAASASRDAKTASAEITQPAAKRRKPGPEAALKDDTEAKEILDSHEEFLVWYISFLKSELLPTASYQRHITALRAALLALKIGKHAGATGEYFDMEIAEMISSDYTWIRLLLDLLMDPFDDVREHASTLLSLFPQEIVNAPTKSAHYPATLLEILLEFCPRAQALADQTGRADHGDGAARSQGLLCGWLHDQERQIGLVSSILDGLDAKISKAENDLGHAVVENPVHPDFAALSYAWPVLAKATYSAASLSSLQEIHTRIFACSQRIWIAVRHVLCDDSPEGHLPEEMEDIDGLDTKDLLSYSFRAVHESSNLLRLIVGTLRQPPAEGVPFPPLDVFKNTGNLTFEQLSNLRHRGAFSTVSLTFTTCCQLTQNLPTVFPDTAMSDSDGLLREWYTGTLTCIKTQASTTRRSAGIPSLVSAVLSANAASPSFAEVFTTLEEIAKKEVTMTETDGSNLPQVHALNSLREIFRSSALSKKAEGLLAGTLQLAAGSLRSDVWAIRNCGLLLLRSLIDSLLGTGESKAVIESGWDGVSIRISYNKYPTLPGVILGLLKSAGSIFTESPNSAAAEAVFPALDIIRRAGPPEEYREELWGHIAGYLGSRIWHVREIAARTLCSFLLQGEWLPRLEGLLEGGGESANRIHGVLMTARFAIERKAGLGEDVDWVEVQRFLTDLSALPAFKSCPVVQAAGLEISNLLSSLNIGDVLPLDQLLPSTTNNDAQSPAGALLRMETCVKTVHDTARSNVDSDLANMRNSLLDILTVDTNTACRMLEAMPKAWNAVQTSRMGDGGQVDEITPALCDLYAEVCHRPAAPEARARALLNLGALVDGMLGCLGVEGTLPSAEKLDKLWVGLQRKGEVINPTLACAIIGTSGSLMAARMRLGNGDGGMERQLRNWGVMMGDSLGVDNTFDTRIAAVTALRSFFVGVPGGGVWSGEHYLAVFSALYDGLVDDDDEIREVAAAAASGLTGRYMVASEAADYLVSWLGDRFGRDDGGEFSSLVVSRMVGQVSGSGSVLNLSSAEGEIKQALDFDDSLFAAEEQNLFIDEVRETGRWRDGAFCGLGDGEKGVEALRKWVGEGLEFIVKLVEAKGVDGPLGWTTDQHVFAVVARVVICAVGLVRRGGCEEVGVLLERFRGVGEGGRVHGVLLEMARV